MIENKLSTNTSVNLFSKQALSLPPKERLELLLSAESYPIVSKRTSAEAQIKEMIDFYDICGIMLAQYLPDKKSEDIFSLISLLVSQETQMDDEIFQKACNMLSSFEELERKIRAIQNLFYKYVEIFPDLASKYGLEDRAFEKISDIVESSRESLNNPTCTENQLFKRWEIQISRKLVT